MHLLFSGDKIIDSTSSIDWWMLPGYQGNSSNVGFSMASTDYRCTYLYHDTITRKEYPLNSTPKMDISKRR